MKKRERPDRKQKHLGRSGLFKAVRSICEMSERREEAYESRRKSKKSICAFLHCTASEEAGPLVCGLKLPLCLDCS